MLSLKLIQAGRDLVDSLSRVLFFMNHTAESFEVRLHLLELDVQRSLPRTSRHEEVEVTQQHKREHEATARNRDDLSDTKHLAATRGYKFARPHRVAALGSARVGVYFCIHLVVSPPLCSIFARLSDE